ncbi:MAG: ATP-binding protein [Clostridia bacterium]|nr:ATP-binding protein [Clostridia bacterium]
MKEQIEKLISAARANAAISPEDYINPEDGLLYCGACSTSKEKRLNGFGKEMVVPCMCKCETEKHARDEAERKRLEQIAKIGRMKASGLQDRSLYNYTFANDHGDNPLMKKAKAYVEHWPEFYEQNIGLLLFGAVGTGKSFFAGCIANALIEQGIPVLMTNFSRILNSLNGMFNEDRNEYINSLNRYSLLIIDDLGIERNTEYALEQVFNVIDSRYRSKKPMIITTNLGLYDIQHPEAEDIAHARIYDRILEVCQPIFFKGKNYRTENAQIARDKISKILSD